MMQIKNNLSVYFLLLIITTICIVGYQNISKNPNSTSQNCKHENCLQINSLKMICAIEKYAHLYNIPFKYAYGIAYAETRFCGPLHWNYKHDLVSSAGAVGPMQVMYTTAQTMWPDSNFSLETLRTDIDFNVSTSMKLLRYLYNMYGDWKLVFGAYNTGQPCVNDYAVLVYSFNSKNHWLQFLN